jgi:hypothetical protein
LNADFTDAFGYGPNAMPPVGTNAGQVTWASSTTYGLWRVFVGSDDMVYISGGGTLTVGPGVVMCPPNLASGTYLFPLNANNESPGQYVDCVATANATGSYAAGNLTLYTCEWDRSGPGGYQTVWQYPFYTTTNVMPNPAPETFTGNGTPLPLPWNIASVTPNVLPSSGGCASIYGYGGNGNPNIDVAAGIGSVNTVLADMYIAPDGKFFCSEERGANTGTQSLWVYDSITNGSCLLWDDLDVNGGVSPFATAYSVSVSPDDNYFAMGCSSASGNAGNDGKVLVCSLDTQLAATGNNVSGLPDISTISLITYDGNSSLRGTAWDMADNVYCVSGSDDSMRAFSLGLTTTAITANDTTGTNGTFSLSFPSVSVSVEADEPLISQPNSYGNPTSGTFTLTRTGSTASSLAVFYTLSGTATNGATYTASSANTVKFPIGASSVQVTITANTNIADASTLSVILTLQGSASYLPTPPASATMEIASTGPQEIAITSVTVPSMYRGISNDFASFIITRYGDTNAPAYTIPATSFTYGGTATLGVDYLGAVGPVTFNPGDQTETVQVSDPVATSVYHGNESILVTLNTNALLPILAGSASLTVVDNSDPPAPVLWSDPLTSAADSVNWTLTFANSNLGPTTVPPIVIPDYPNYTALNPDPNAPGSGTGLDDFDVEFGYNVTNDNVGYSPAMLLHGWTNALKMTVNKITGYDGFDPATGGGASAGANVYPAGMKFSGNYAFRFSMNLSEGTTYTTEYNSFGINHYGTNCNWFATDTTNNATTNQDGIWFWIDADVDGTGGTTSYNSYTIVTGPPLPNSGWNPVQSIAAFTTPYTTWFGHPPYNGYPSGVPNDGFGAAANTWADVEVKQVNGVITMSINKFPILVYTNVTNANSGDVMLGYDDPFASVGNVAGGGVSGASVYYSNARVVQLTPPAISTTTLSGTTLTIAFTDSDTDDTAASFELLGSTLLNGTFAKVAATFSQSPTTGGWQAVVTVPSGTAHIYYEVVRKN